jgi:hypothetical protein
MANRWTFSEFCFRLSDWCLTWATTSAVSLSHYLYKELLGHRLPMSDISRIYWFVPSPPQVTAIFSVNVADTVMGIFGEEAPDGFSFTLEISYFAISLSLNVLLTLMIIVRLALHSRNIRNAIGASSGAGGLYTAIITMLVESSALNAIGYLLSIITETVGSNLAYTFSSVLGHLQVRCLCHFPTYRHCLIIEAHRPSLCSSSFYGSRTEVH